MASTAYTKSSSLVKLQDESQTPETIKKIYTFKTYLKGGDTLTIDKFTGMTAIATIKARSPHIQSRAYTASISGNTVTVGGNTTSGATDTPRKYATIEVTFVPE